MELEIVDGLTNAHDGLQHAHGVSSMKLIVVVPQPMELEVANMPESSMKSSSRHHKKPQKVRYLVPI